MDTYLHSLEGVAGHYQVPPLRTHHISSPPPYSLPSPHSSDHPDHTYHPIRFHLDLAEGLQASCDLELLNPGHEGEQFMSCSSSDPKVFRQQVQATWRTISLSRPSGQTPLSQHIYQIQNRISQEAANLRARGQRICVILATDGLPSDNPKGIWGGARDSFQEALNSLHGLPVWFVVRLLTDAKNVVAYYNDLDQQVIIFCHSFILKHAKMTYLRPAGSQL